MTEQLTNWFHRAGFMTGARYTSSTSGYMSRFSGNRSDRFPPSSTWYEDPLGAPQTIPHMNDWEREVAEQLSRKIHAGDLFTPHLPEDALEAIWLATSAKAPAEELPDLLHHAPYLISRSLLKQIDYAGGIQTLANATQADHGRPALRAILRNITESLHHASPPQQAEQTEIDFHHALATARAAEHLCQGLDVRGSMTVYAAALLHDVGLLAVTLTMRHVLSHGEELRPSIHQHLRHVLHEDAGLQLAHRWGLPHGIAEIIGNHHGVINANDPLANLRALIQCADHAAIRCGYGDEPLTECLVKTPCARFLHLDSEKAEAIFAPLPDELTQLAG